MTLQKTHTQYAIIYNLYDGEKHAAHLEKKIAGRDAGKSKLYNYSQHTAAEVRKIIKELDHKNQPKNRKGEQKIMKNYWKVTTKFYNSGKVKAEIISITSEDLPKNYHEENVNFDLYIDYFDNEQQARKFYQNALKT